MSSGVTKIIQIIIMAATIASVFFCSTKPDSTDPSKAKITPFIKTSDSIVSEGTFLDTAGKPITICTELFLPENFDSIGLTITLDNQTVLDTVLREIVYNVFFDTIQMAYTFTSSGTYLITFTPYTSINIKPAIISAVIAPRANRQPGIAVSGKTNFLPGETCILVLQSSDPDSGQILTTSINGQPEGSIFLNNTFTWVIPSDFTGSDTVEFSVTDNGTPPLCSTITVILTVAAETLNSAPVWSTDTIKVAFDDTSACSILLSDKCIDNDGDSLTFLLLQRAPDTDSIKDGVYSFRATPLSAGTWYPAIVAIDPHGASDTLIVKMTISQLPSSSVLLASIAFSAGTLREKTEPVPDTIYDTVSFNDSALTITFTPFNIQSSITVNGSVIPTGTTTLPVNLAVGKNGFQVILKSPDNSISRSYHVIVLRKQLQPVFTLDILISPAGSGTVSKIKDTTVYISGSMVTLNATPAPGYRFKDWGGDTSTAGNTLSLLMKKNRTVTANFVRQYTLTMAVTGTGTTTPSTGATLAVDSGVVTSISAVAGTGYKFKNWTCGQNGVVFDNATAANTGVKLTQGHATVMAVFKGITFSRTLPVGEDGGTNLLANAIPGVDSGYVIAGSADGQGFIIRLNTAGDIVMNKNDQYNFSDIRSINQAGAGYVIAGVYNSRAAIAYMDSDCNFIWFKQIGDEGSIASVARQTPDMGYLVAGNINMNYYILKTISSGEVLWSAVINPGTVDAPSDCWPTTDGQYLIGGAAYVGSSAYVIKLDNTGEKVWDSYYDNVLVGSAHSTAVISVWEASDGYIIAGMGNPYGSTSTDFIGGILLKTSVDGTAIWSRYYSDFKTIRRAFQTQSDGGYILAGDTYTKGPGGRDIYLVKTNSIGEITWERAFGTATADEYLKSMEITSDGGYLLLGSTGLIVKTDKNGNVE